MDVITYPCCDYINGCKDLSMLELKLSDASKRGPSKISARIMRLKSATFHLRVSVLASSFSINSWRPSDAYMRRLTNHNRFRKWLPDFLTEFSLWCLIPWINYLPSVCWSTFWKYNLKDSWYVSLTQWRLFFSLLLILFMRLWYFLIHKYIMSY